jgi:class 3 adenylate cyclase/tetratricopeptide (TPR) repeat protein
MKCKSCGWANAADNRFCGRCGTAFPAGCPSCGGTVPLGQPFCGQCGRAMSTASEQPGVDTTTPVATTISELRWASVLFVDLVEFTPLTVGWDAEEIRELLAGYYQVASTIVQRYGGMVEKFIGDAVVAAWGARSSREDDPARAVRAGLEIVAAVSGHGELHQLSGLVARAGVVTGQVASWSGAGPGLVAGDRVNLAARVQSEAEPGGVLVDEVTMRATRSSVAYAEAGERVLKGFSDPLALWRAVRAFAPDGGVRHPDALEASFIGRARELSMVKELFHAAADDGRARLVAVSGVAGIGKSRLAWEFELYVEGLAEDVFWHRGRCPSYGEGVAFWALAEMMRERFGIAADDTLEVAAARLAVVLPDWVPNVQEREFVEPRVGVLIGTVDRAFSQEELFAGWRLFLERLAAIRPVVLVFEDLHWADRGLVDFIEYLLDWSAGKPLYMLTLARPDLAERRPGWATGRVGASVLHLDPLPQTAMDRLIDELVPGMPAEMRDRIASQSGGIPLYAVETIRSLLDRGLVVRSNGVHHLEGALQDLDVPASLTALIAARLDALPSAERELVMGLAVLGDSFHRGAVSAVSDAPEEAIDDGLRALVRKEVLQVQPDSMSLGRDEYAFLQPLVRSVAHEALSRKARKVRHRAAAEYLSASYPDKGADVAEMIAAHLLEAYSAASNDPEAPVLRRQAAEGFERAGDRAAAVGSPDSAEGYYRTAAELAEDEADQVRCVTAAATMAERAGRPDDALALFESAAEAHRTAGRTVAAARIVAGSGWARVNYRTDLEMTLQQLQEAARVLEGAGIIDELASLRPVLASALITLGSDPRAAAEHLESGLVLSTALENYGGLVAGLHTKAQLLASQHRVVEATALFSAVAEISRDHDDLEMEAIARGSLGQLLLQADLPTAAAELELSLKLSNRLGHALFEAENASQLGTLYHFLGNWDEAERCARQAIEISQRAHLPDGRLLLVLLLTGRGDLDEAQQQVDALEDLAEHGDLENSLDLSRAVLARAENRLGDAAESAGRVARDVLRTAGQFSSRFRLAWPLAVESALSAGDVEETRSLLDLVEGAPIGHVPPYIRAQRARLAARLASKGDEEGTQTGLETSIRIFGEHGYAYWTARAQSDLACWLHDRGRREEAEPLFTQAAEVFRRVGAVPDLSRMQGLGSNVER